MLKIGSFVAVVCSWSFGWCAATVLGSEASAPDARSSTSPDVTVKATAARPTEFLEEVWPGYPEWLAMLAEILAGNQINPDSGWFKKGVSQSRFDWKMVREHFDGDRDGKITPEEFSGSAPEFKRLDRDRDGVVTAFDIGLSAREATLPRVADEYSLAAFRFTDRDENGKVTGSEINQLFYAGRVPPAFDLILASIRQELTLRYDAARQEGHWFLSLSDFQEAFDLTARRGILPDHPIGAPPPRDVTKETLLRGFLRRELGAWGSGPALNALAPDFSLPRSDGRGEVTLSKLLQTKPVVLIFGNFTCGELRNHVGSLEALYRQYKERAHFALIYTRESHPLGGWELEENRRARVVLRQHRNFGEKVDAAQVCRRTLGLDIPVLVDSMNDGVGNLYSGMPIRLYLLDQRGGVAYKSGRGPYGFKPAELQQSLILLLQSEAASVTRSPVQINRSQAQTR